MVIPDYSEKMVIPPALTDSGIVEPTGVSVRPNFVEVPIRELPPPCRAVSQAEALERLREEGGGR